MIPTHADQPTNSFYNASKPATYAPEHDLPEQYPSPLDSGVTGRHRPDRRRAEVRVRHRRHLRHALAAGRRQRLRLRRHARRRLRERPEHQRPVLHQQLPARAAGVGLGDHPAADLRHVHVRRRATATWTCSSRTPATPSSGSTPTRPDADARAIQAAYWADTWAKAQGNGRGRLGDRGQGRQDGRLPAVLLLRQVLQEDRQLHQPELRGRHRQGQRALPALLVLRLGRRDRHRAPAGPGASATAPPTTATRTRSPRRRCPTTRRWRRSRRPASTTGRRA